MSEMADFDVKYQYDWLEEQYDRTYARYQEELENYYRSQEFLDDEEEYPR